MATFKYYTLITLSSSGQRQLREIEEAKLFFTDTFNHSHTPDSLSDIFIQDKLLTLLQNNSDKHSLLAQRCLLCFISWQIEQVCLSLENKFGSYHGFTSNDLLGYVLDDDGRLESSNNYQCLSREILTTFDRGKSSLTTWTNRKVKQHRDLNKFLLECGLYLVSDWAILNDTKPQQLPKILGDFHGLTNLEVTEAQQIITAYHKVYRTERFRQRMNRQIKSKCEPPTTQQLQEIANILESTAIKSASTKIIMKKLQILAEQLRKYRIYIRGGFLPTLSLDEKSQDNLTLTDKNIDHNYDRDIIDGEESENFLTIYRSQFVHCFDSAIKKVIDLRVKKLQKKDPDKAMKFLIGLQLFHCQRLAMSKIAAKLNLRAQDAVARLLKLKDFRTDVRHETIVMLKQQVIDLAEKYINSSRLINLDDKITEVLDEQIANVINHAEVEAASMQRSCEISYFSQRLCEYLDNK